MYFITVINNLFLAIDYDTPMLSFEKDLARRACTQLTGMKIVDSSFEAKEALGPTNASVRSMQIGISPPLFVSMKMPSSSLSCEIILTQPSLEPQISTTLHQFQQGYL